MFEGLTKVLTQVILQVKDKSPEILTAAGVVGVVGTAVLASRATLNLEPIINQAKEDLAKVELARKIDPEEYTEKKAKEDRLTITTRSAVDTIKLYAPAVIVGLASIACLVGSNKILRGRNAALASAYGALDSAFRAYRKRVVEKHGVEEDRDLMQGARYETRELEDGEQVKVRIIEGVTGSSYARLYDETLMTWRRSHDDRMMFLKHVESQCNDELKVKGHIFLNDVYAALGMEKSRAGQVVGWVYNTKNGDGYVDFGLSDYHKRGVREFVAGQNDAIWLDFNVDGPIMEILQDEFKTRREVLAEQTEDVYDEYFNMHKGVIYPKDVRGIEA